MQRIITVDDVDQTTEGAKPHEFVVNGRVHQIELAAENSARLAEIKAAHKERLAKAEAEFANDLAPFLAAIEEVAQLSRGRGRKATAKAVRSTVPPVSATLVPRPVSGPPAAKGPSFYSLSKTDRVTCREWLKAAGRTTPPILPVPLIAEWRASLAAPAKSRDDLRKNITERIKKVAADPAKPATTKAAKSLVTGVQGSPDDLYWMSADRKGLNHHLHDGKGHTLCGRPINSGRYVSADDLPAESKTHPDCAKAQGKRPTDPAPVLFSGKAA